MPHIATTPIPGLLVVSLDVHEDSRGWFKENWQREKLTALGLPDLRPVQHNISFNARAGVTRGLHAEPWDKLVSVATGRVFGAWVDLREGPGLGRVHTQEIGPDTAVLVPRGVANGFQVLADATAYSYLVTEHWRPDAGYTEVDLADPALAIPWPIPLTDPRVECSAKDRANPRLADVRPMGPAPVLVIGRGQVGTALAEALPHAVVVGRETVDLADPDSVRSLDLRGYAAVVNAAAMTRVDAAETPEGRREAWAVNATGPALLAARAEEHHLPLVHFSSDYVYDGTRAEHVETDPLAPLGVYGQTKAAGDLAVLAAPRGYVVRTSWVVGEGANFVATMRRLAREGVCPSVVDDQVGRLTFASDLARATVHLLDSGATPGVYHVTGGGEPRSWAGWAREVFAASGRSPDDVTPVDTTTYAAGRPLAPRPASSVLSTARIEATGFVPRDAAEQLAEHLAAQEARP